MAQSKILFKGTVWNPEKTELQYMVYQYISDTHFRLHGHMFITWFVFFFGGEGGVKIFVIKGRSGKHNM